MTRRATRGLIVLWIVFLGAHLVTAMVGWIAPSQPMGDVVLVYEPWATQALSGGPIVGITATWVYPQLALVPMLAAKLLSLPLIPALGVSSAYLLAWAAMVTLLDALAFRMLVGGTARRSRRSAAWFWSAALLLLGPIAMYRIDAVTVPLAVVAGLWLVTRPALAAALLTLAAWIKIWPGVLLVAALVALKARVRMLLGAALVSAAVVGAVLLLGGGHSLFGFLTEQTGRGLQIEAVAATPFLWLAVAGTARIEYSFDILTFQIAADGAGVVAAVLTPLMVVVVLALAAVGVSKAMRGASFQRLFPPLALSLVVALVVCNKVGSPQFESWLLAPVILWLVLDAARARVAALLVLVLVTLTFLVYPLSYDALLRAELLPVLVLTLRNALLLVLLVIGILALVRVPSARPSRSDTT